MPTPITIIDVSETDLTSAMAKLRNVDLQVLGFYRYTVRTWFIFVEVRYRVTIEKIAPVAPLLPINIGPVSSRV
jgi:hypothetical protein